MMSIKASPTLTQSAYEKVSDGVDIPTVREMSPPQYQSAHRLETQPGYWLGAATGLGQVYLRVATGNVLDSRSDANVTESVLAMQKIESAIQLFEDWLGIALNLVPVSDTPQEQQIKMEFIAKEDTSLQGLLSLPVACLPAIAKPLEELSQVFSMQWKSLPMELGLSRIRITQQQLEKIEAGGMYLLTESFRHDWYCEIGIPGIRDKKFRVKINTPNELEIVQQNDGHHEKPITDISETEAEDLHYISVRLVNSVHIPADYLMHWAENAAVDLEGSLFSSPVYLLHDEQRIASGNIVPVSHGFAMHISDLIDN